MARQLQSGEAVAAVRAFAQEVLSGWEGLENESAMPERLWSELAERGLLGLMAPRLYGGAGIGLSEMMSAAEVMTARGGVVGVTSAWFAHNHLASYLLGGHGSETQAATLWPRVATGELTVAFAASEPGAGAHPKRLTTRAEQDAEGNWHIDGQKAYVTNGPIAGLFAVVAVTHITPEGRKQYGVFLVPRNAPGLTITDDERVGFLRPAAHAHLALQDVTLPDAARLGLAGPAYDRIVLPLRDVEDHAHLTARLGGLERLVAALAQAGPREGEAGRAVDTALGDMTARIALLRQMIPSAGTDATSLLGVRTMLREATETLNRAIADSGTTLPPREAVLARDLTKLTQVASYAIAAKLARIGQRLRP